MGQISIYLLQTATIISYLMIFNHVKRQNYSEKWLKMETWQISV